MTVYADSSALVPLYADEPGRARLDSQSPVAISQVARVEVTSALWRKQRTGELTLQQAQDLSGDFTADYYGDLEAEPRFAVVPVTSAIVEDAARLVAVHGLRAYDAVHLSTAIAARSADPGCSQFASYDDELRRAAATQGFRLIP